MRYKTKADAEAGEEGIVTKAAKAVKQALVDLTTTNAKPAARLKKA